MASGAEGGGRSPEELRLYALLNDYIEQLLSNQAAPLPPDLGRDELIAYVLAAELAGTRSGEMAPREEFVEQLQDRLHAELLQRGLVGSPLPFNELPAPSPAPTSLLVTNRASFLKAAGGLAAGVLIGVALDHEVNSPTTKQPTSALELVGSDGRWYRLAAVQEIPQGSIRRFSAGGIDGYLVHRAGQLRAFSAICTHMGCHVDWREDQSQFHCMCHGARFHATGELVNKGKIGPLPQIRLRIEGGQILAWGTAQTSWG